MRTLNDYFLTMRIENIGGAANVAYVVAPDAGRIIKMMSCIDGTIATADEDLTLKINGTGVTGGVLTIAESGSAAWDKDEIYPTALNEVVEGDMIEVENDSACTNDVDCAITLVIRR